MDQILGLLAGAAGGNIAGMALKNLNQGTLINSVSGIVGGALGGNLLGIEGIIGQIIGGGVGGSVVLAIVGVVKNMMNK